MARFHVNVISRNKAFVSWNNTETPRYRYLPIELADPCLYKTIGFAYRTNQPCGHHVFINGFRLSPMTIQVKHEGRMLLLFWRHML
jgi:hypothetical protein